MHVSSLVAASILAGAASAHGGIPTAPKLFGRNAIADLKARNAFDAPRAPRAPVAAPAVPQRPAGEKRQVGGADGQCGAGIGSCAKGYCCSLAGWCGIGKDYCAAPDCQFQFGSGCDANTIPPGTNTSSVARPVMGSVPVGNGGIYDCTVPGTVALTFDDGPYIYTDGVLDLLKRYNASATFFITGNNIGKGEIDNAAYGWDTVIKRMHAEGHQIASHTWSHQNLSQITSAQRKDQMYKNEMALRNILGFFPTYMRPPYSACDQPSGCWRDMKNLGYHVTYFDVDTDDYNNESPELIQNAKDNYDKAMAGGDPSTSDYLVIGHDIHEQTARNLTEYMLIQLQNQGYKAVTVGECLGDPRANWYRSSSGSVFTSATGPVTNAPTSTLPVNSKTTTTSPVVTPTGISQDATCGGTTGNTCLGSSFGNCCSVNGWCGSTSDYCADGCQVQFGNCSGSSGPVSNVSVSAMSTPLSTPSGSGSASAPTGTRQVTPDGSCGGTKGYTCLNSGFGNCCSQYGYCGSTSDYCGSTCQSGFGTCGSSSQVSNSISSVSSKAPIVSSAAGSSILTPSAVKSSSAPVVPSVSVSLSSVKAVVSTPSVSVGASSLVTKTTSTSTTTVKSTVASSTTAKASSLSSTTAKASSASSVKAAASSTKSSSAPTSTALKTSTDGRCGAAAGSTCSGSYFGGCCGQDNYCGSFFACANGCQNKFGSCWF
ncbi:uncharacterized protein IWZ02DRAFT_440166, partial [Phyllosticta citriasiana]